ncbi:minor capsid protein [Arthrobacter phage EastWest]|uniref:Minor capsid protein n=1 Tax=Arthrobacter phage EastWest TaxID=2894292 RepID=A0AAE8YK38_9CAUD|nr:minor capsid protein [Arthrobacter phage EastWest]
MFGKANQAFEYFSASDAITCEAAGPIVGKTFVVLAPGGRDQRPKVVTAAAGDRPYGVAAWDAATGEALTIIRTGVISVTAGAALTPGAVAVGADGKAVAAAAAPAVSAGFVHADAPINTDAAVALSI